MKPGRHPSDKRRYICQGCRKELPRQICTECGPRAILLPKEVTQCFSTPKTTSTSG